MGSTYLRAESLKNGVASVVQQMAWWTNEEKVGAALGSCDRAGAVFCSTGGACSQVAK